MTELETLQTAARDASDVWVARAIEVGQAEEAAIVAARRADRAWEEGDEDSWQIEEHVYRAAHKTLNAASVARDAAVAAVWEAGTALTAWAAREAQAS